MTRKVFISHKNTDDSNDAGQLIYDYLKENGHDPFFDKESLKMGKDWNDSIRDGLIKSQLLILIVDSETVKSSWVQREVDMARALNISILPIILDNFADVTAAFSKFDIETIQFAEYVSPRSRSRHPKFLKQVLADIELLCKDTHTAQTQYWNDWKDDNKVKKTPGNRNPSAAIFVHPDAPHLQFHIATGDASLVKQYDVLVNTENNYMQMARFFEVKTLSYSVRTHGAYFEDGEILADDTIQDELYLNAKSKGGLPIRDRRILVTGAGHVLSRMKRVTDYRYIFHAAAVRIRLEEREVDPVDDVCKLITNCIEKIAKIDTAKGAVKLGEDEYLIPEVERYTPITSILFPPFGTGDGGKSLREAATEIISCFAKQVPTTIDEFKLKVERIGLSIFFEEDVELIANVFREMKFEDISEL